MINNSRYKSRLKKLMLEEKEWIQQKEILDKKKAIRDAKNEYRPKLKISTTKLIMIFIFANCSIIELYSMWIMFVLADLSGLGSLITAVVGETISFAVYAYKSTKENTQGGIIYEKMKMNNTSLENSDDSSGVG